jgi:hypothetical protein
MPSRAATRLCSALVFAVSSSVAVAAHAQEAPLPPLPRVHVSAEGPDEALLEERTFGAADGEDGWRQLCYLPCNTTVTPDPYAQHRIVDGKRKRHVGIRGVDGEHVVLTYTRAPTEGTALLVGGIVVAGAGLAFAVAAVATAIAGPRTSSEPCADAACYRRRADAETARTTSNTLFAVGGVLGMAGAAGIVLGVITSRSTTRVSAPGATTAARVQPRAPTWSQPELPKPPNHTNVVELRF